MISLFHEDLIFTKLLSYAKFRENKTLAKISEFTVLLAVAPIVAVFFCVGLLF